MCTDARVGDLVARGVDGSGPVHLVRQVHGAAVAVFDEHEPMVGAAAGVEADAIVIDRPHVAIGIRTADCVPIALVADGGDAVAVVHAGWPGTLAGVVPAAIAALAARGATRLDAVIGPCIRGTSYEFGPDGIDAFAARFGEGVRATTTWGTPALDLVAAVRRELEAGGVATVDDVGIDTYGSPGHRSYRRDGTPERNLTVAWTERPAGAGAGGGNRGR